MWLGGLRHRPGPISAREQVQPHRSPTRSLKGRLAGSLQGLAGLPHSPTVSVGTCAHTPILPKYQGPNWTPSNFPPELQVITPNLHRLKPLVFPFLFHGPEIPDLGPSKTVGSKQNVLNSLPSDTGVQGSAYPMPSPTLALTSPAEPPPASREALGSSTYPQKLQALCGNWGRPPPSTPHSLVGALPDSTGLTWKDLARPSPSPGAGGCGAGWAGGEVRYSFNPDLGLGNKGLIEPLAVWSLKHKPLVSARF